MENFFKNMENSSKLPSLLFGLLSMVVGVGWGWKFWKMDEDCAMGKFAMKSIRVFRLNCRLTG